MLLRIINYIESPAGVLRAQGCVCGDAATIKGRGQLTPIASLRENMQIEDGYRVHIVLLTTSIILFNAGYTFSKL